MPSSMQVRVPGCVLLFSFAAIRSTLGFSLRRVSPRSPSVQSFLPSSTSHFQVIRSAMAGNSDNDEKEGNQKRKNPTAPSTGRKSQPAEPPPPTCFCRLPACERTVKKEGPTQGRKFWGCAQWPKGCKFFEWIADEQEELEQVKENSPPPKKPKKTGVAMKLLTWNVAEFKPHSYAPPGFDPQSAFLQELKRHQPDVLALQELPRYGCSFPGYQQIGTAPSHCGLVGLYVRNEGFLQQEQVKRISMTDDLPVVLASIPLANGAKLVAASCHLEPYKEGSEIRLAQLQGISKAAAHNSKMIVAGDMNMRQSEDEAVEAFWKDAWKEAGGDRRDAYTWNSKVNRYHGSDAFGFHCRFDRVYLGGAVGVQSFRLVGNQPLRNDSIRDYYLSDHFGIVATVVIE